MYLSNAAANTHTFKNLMDSQSSHQRLDDALVLRHPYRHHDYRDQLRANWTAVVVERLMRTTMIESKEVERALHLELYPGLRMSSSSRSYFGLLNVFEGHFGHKYSNGSFAGHSTIKIRLWSYSNFWAKN
ncbi:hypothetical protein TorRG33x02_136940 [Trema orientale]|uniref:Uncharacterized protein n=1 Tax=Trema orientale TaxID=63057 RepID=A0A2P5EY02_TREOI|nr:hypothetical protein TorRG33x02_136940 [Trema orientale]